MIDTRRLSIHQVTLLRQCSTPQFVAAMARNDVRCTSLWREKTLEYGVQATARLCADNGIALSGFRIPALTTRYAQTEVELRDGQSFAIAGLLNTIGQEDKAGIPILSKIPVIGHIFRSQAQRTEQTELMVIVTPKLTRPLNPDEVPPLPTSTPGLTGGGLAVEPAAPGTTTPQP